MVAPKATSVPETSNNNPQITISKSNNISDPAQTSGNHVTTSGMGIQKSKRIGEAMLGLQVLAFLAIMISGLGIVYKLEKIWLT